MASSKATTKGKIKKVKETNLTFSNRKQGLFNKVTELSLLCQAETALIVSSQNGKLHACGYPSPDAVIQRFLSGRGSSQESYIKKQGEKEALRVEYEALEYNLKQEKELLNNIIEEKKTGVSSPSWWNKNIDEMSLEDLEQFAVSLEQLKLNLVATEDQRKFISKRPMPVPISVVSMRNSTNQVSNEYYNRHWSWNNNASSSNGIPMNEYFNGYQECSWNTANTSQHQECYGNTRSNNFVTPNGFNQY